MEGVHELGAEPAMLRRKAADTEQMQQRDFDIEGVLTAAAR